MLFISLDSFAQERKATKRTSKYYSTTDFIGTWELKKYADVHLSFTKKQVKSETLIFTKDSIFVNLVNKKYCGVWKLEDRQPIITIKETKRFNYHWLGRGADHIFFTSKGLGYYKYFERVSN